MRKLSEHTIERIVSLLKEGKPLPDDYKSVLFENKREYELVYAGKERAEDILADTMAVPLQPVKTFQSDESSDDWTNMLIFGDNLQVLKTLLQMKHEGKLKNADGTPGVRLIYIDPPFATKQEFRGNRGQKAYQDKIAGSRFLEFLRKRLIFLRELLANDGSIWVHLDDRAGHYIKVLLDEIFGCNNFVNQIIWHYPDKLQGNVNRYPNNHNFILVYAKTPDVCFYRQKEKLDQPVKRSAKFWNKNENKLDVLRDEEGRIIYKEFNERTIDDVWRIPQRSAISVKCSEYQGYPTQKPEKLLDLIVKSGSKPGDLIADVFCGSGTTLAVAEKLGRRWIGVDCGKLAIYTTQRRLLNIAESKDLEDSQKKRKYGKPCRPFTLYSAGLYDYKMIKELPWEQYREFALKLFQCQDKRHVISKIELDGYLNLDSVLVFNYHKHKNAVLDRGFIDDLHRYIGNKIGKRFFIIAPAASVVFLEDYIEKGKTKYFILRIPYSIIEEIYNRGFTRIRQPVSEMDVNDTIEAVGFDFIQVPAVECKYARDAHECVIKIDKFESNVISRKPLRFDNLETLSMVMLDYDFNGEVFNLDEVFYAEDLKSNGYEIRFAKNKVKGQIMIIYVDIFGNEKREVKTLADFNGERD